MSGDEFEPETVQRSASCTREKARSHFKRRLLDG
jgi:hypothetical protein